MNPSPRLVVIGSSNTDLVVRSLELPRPGETVMGGEFQIHPGGKGANQAVAAARAGAHVTFVARIGADPFGDAALRRFRDDSIDTQYITRSRTKPSGVALILVDHCGENLISVAPGSNHELSPRQVQAAAPAIRQAHGVVAQLEVPLPAVEAAARLASGYGVPMIVNPAPAQRLAPGLLAQLTCLTPNEGELALLTGRPVRHPADIPAAAARLLDQGVLHVIVTRGAQGVCWCSRSGVRWLKAIKARPVDTVGAGDCFTGALAAALGGREPTEHAIQFAMRAAAISVTRTGAQPSMPHQHEILAAETPRTGRSGWHHPAGSRLPGC
jgi:ribokinase